MLLLEPKLIEMAKSKSKKPLYVVKIGGNILDDEKRLSAFLSDFAALEDAKILIHGGGKLAAKLAEQLGVPSNMVEGRRVTNSETLRIVTMVYGGLLNKQIVARLHGLGCNSMGVCGADGDLLRAHKRRRASVDFGWVGDIDKVNAKLLHKWVKKGTTPVVAPLSHDGKGQLLNTNADSIAQEIAQAMGEIYAVELIFGFEKSGVLLDVNNESSRIVELSHSEYKAYKRKGLITAGMIPKLDNAFSALEKGVKRVVIGPAEHLNALIKGKTGTAIVPEAVDKPKQSSGVGVVASV